MHKVHVVDGVAFATGLLWQSVVNQSKWRTEVQPVARKIAATYGVLRTGKVIQAGLGQITAEHKKVYALAAIVSKSIEVLHRGVSSYIVAIKLADDAWYLTGGINNTIIPDCDNTFRSETEARAQLYEHLGLSDWGLIICPANWGVGDSQEQPLDHFLPKDRKGRVAIKPWSQLTPLEQSIKERVKRNPKVVLLAGVTALVCVGLYGAYTMMDSMRLRAQIVEAEAPVPTQAPPWEAGLVTPQSLLNACLSTRNHDVQPVISSWKLTALRCDASSVAMVYSRGASTPILPFRQAALDASIDLENGGSVASRSLPLQVDPATGVIVPDRTQLLLKIAEAKRLTRAIKFEPVPHPIILDDKGRAIPPPPWSVFAYEVPVKTPNLGVLSGMACEASEVSFMTDTKTWLVKGNCYAQ